MKEVKKADAPKILRTLCEIWADQNGCSLEIIITKKGKGNAT